MNETYYNCVGVVRSIEGILTENIDDVIEGKEKLVLPHFPVIQLQKICQEVDKIFQTEPILLEINQPILVVGDLHGHLLDLLRIFRNYGFPPRQSYIFLGDYIDRGEYSLETVIFIYAFKVLYPKNVYMIRGNHEFFSNFNSSQIFSTECETHYPRTKLYETIINSFASMPLAAKLFNKVLCIHGGISPDFVSLEQLKQFQRPITDYNNDPILTGLLWSDPNRNDDHFAPSRRKTGFLFGVTAFQNFCANNNISYVLRGHECVMDGYQLMFGGKLITVFSSSNYCGTTGNKAAVLFVDKTDMKPIALDPLGYIKRDQTIFLPSEDFLDMYYKQGKTQTVSIVNPKKPILASLSTRSKLGNILKQHNTHRPLIRSCNSQTAKGLPDAPENFIMYATN